MLTQDAAAVCTHGRSSFHSPFCRAQGERDRQRGGPLATVQSAGPDPQVFSTRHSPVAQCMPLLARQYARFVCSVPIHAPHSSLHTVT